MLLTSFLVPLLLATANLPIARSGFVRSRDCFDSTSYDGAEMRFKLGWTEAAMRRDDGFPLQMSVYGVFNNASTKAANSTQSYKVHAMATVEISTLGFPLLRFNLTEGDFEVGQMHTAPDIAYDEPGFPPTLLFTRNLNADMSFTTLTATIKIYSTDQHDLLLGCVDGNFTQDVGTRFSALLRFAPLAILISCGLAALLSGYQAQRQRQFNGTTYSPPRFALLGIGDVLQYIQFVMLSGSLTLNYPGYYQPLVSHVSWSTLMFNNSFIGRSKFELIEDGIYQINGTEGLQTMSQAIGNVSLQDIWLNMLLCLLCITTGLVILTQLAYFIRWLYRTLAVNHVSASLKEPTALEKLHGTLWTVVKLVFSYFLLPIVAITMFQVYESALLPRYNTYIALAIVFVQLLCLGFLFWYIRRRGNTDLLAESDTIATTKPARFGIRFSPHYGMLPICLTFIRGIAIGGCQGSGSAQLIILITCEVIYIASIIIFRPFPSFFSVHSGLAIWRLLTLGLAVSFVPAMGASVVVRDWMGYVILTMQAGALIVGFLFGALVTVAFTLVKMFRGGKSATLGKEALKGEDEFRVYGHRQLFFRKHRVDDFDSVKLESLESVGPGGHADSYMYDTHTDERSWAFNKSDESLTRHSPSDSTSAEPLLSPRYDLKNGKDLVNPDSRPGQHHASTNTQIRRVFHRLPRSNRLHNQPHELDGSCMTMRELEGDGVPLELEGSSVVEQSSVGASSSDPTPISFPVKNKRDYSTREADAALGVGVRRRSIVQGAGAGGSAAREGEDGHSGSGPSWTAKQQLGGGWRNVLGGLFAVPKPKERGFEVVRPGMPPLERTNVGKEGDVEIEVRPV